MVFAVIITGLVLDDHGQSQALGELRPHAAGDDVHAGARRERNDDLDRLGRIDLRGRAGRAQHRASCKADPENYAMHRGLLLGQYCNVIAISPG
jgi:hypothetical protein